MRPPPAADLAALETIPLDDDALLADFGIDAFLGGVRGVERHKVHLFSPTCTICGMVSGYTGAGSKTVLPAEARAKIDFRLVPDMNPEEIVRLLRAHLDANGFGDVEILEFGHERAARSDPSAGVVRAMAHMAATKLISTLDQSLLIDTICTGVHTTFGEPAMAFYTGDIEGTSTLSLVVQERLAQLAPTIQPGIVTDQLSQSPFVVESRIVQSGLSQVSLSSDEERAIHHPGIVLWCPMRHTQGHLLGVTPARYARRSRSISYAGYQGVATLA